MSDTPAPPTDDMVIRQTYDGDAPAPDVVVLDPLGVKGIEAFLGGFTCWLTNGLQVDVTEQADAADLEKFVGKPTKLRLTCKRVADTLQLVSFAVVD